MTFALSSGAIGASHYVGAWEGSPNERVQLADQSAVGTLYSTGASQIAFSTGVRTVHAIIWAKSYSVGGASITLSLGAVACAWSLWVADSTTTYNAATNQRMLDSRSTMTKGPHCFVLSGVVPENLNARSARLRADFALADDGITYDAVIEGAP